MTAHQRAVSARIEKMPPTSTAKHQVEGIEFSIHQEVNSAMTVQTTCDKHHRAISRALASGDTADLLDLDLDLDDVTYDAVVDLIAGIEPETLDDLLDIAEVIA